MNMQLTLAFRYLAGRKLRTLLTTLAIVFGVLVLFGMNTMLPALTEAFQANVKAATGEVDATITLKTSEPFAQAEAARVAAIDGVIAINGYLSRPVNLPADYFDGDPAFADQITLVTLTGLDLSRATAMHAYPVQEGRFLEPEDSNAAVINESLADALHLEQGASFTLPMATGETTLQVVGLLPASVGNEIVIVTLAQAQHMLDLPEQINAIEANFGVVSATERTALEQNILDAMGESYQVGTLSSNSQFLTTLGLAQVIFSLLGALALLMGGFIIFNTFRTVVAERRRDIGILRTLGANRATILGIILSEGLLQGIIGTALGMLLGYVLATAALSAITPFLQQFVNLQVAGPVISLELLLSPIAIGLGTPLLAGTLPALAASRVTPLEALRPTLGKISIRRMAGLGFWSGAALIAIALALLLSQDINLLGTGGLLFIVGLFLVTPALVTPIANLLSAVLARAYARSGTAQLAEGNLSRQ